MFLFSKLGGVFIIKILANKNKRKFGCDAMCDQIRLDTKSGRRYTYNKLL